MTEKNPNKLVPTTTLSQARVQLFEASQRPSYRDGAQWVVTPWGKCKVTGRLGQRHADVMESLLFCAEARRNLPDGGVEFLVDPARVRRTMSDNQYSYSQIEKLLVEIRAATITIYTDKFDFPVIGGLIDHVVPCSKTRPDPLTGGERHMWKVRIGVALRLLLANDLSLYYDPAPIARLEHGITQAVARHVLTHKASPPSGWHIDTVIGAVLDNPTGQALRKARLRLAEEVEALKKMGIDVDLENKRIFKRPLD